MTKAQSTIFLITKERDTYVLKGKKFNVLHFQIFFLKINVVPDGFTSTPNKSHYPPKLPHHHNRNDCEPSHQ